MPSGPKLKTPPRWNFLTMKNSDVE
jgi:hypothetical protein